MVYNTADSLCSGRPREGLHRHGLWPGDRLLSPTMPVRKSLPPGLAALFKEGFDSVEVILCLNMFHGVQCSLLRLQHSTVPVSYTHLTLPTKA